MTAPDSPRQKEDNLDAALALFSERWFSGEREDPEAFCRAHPECGSGLRELIEDFILVTDVFPRDGGGSLPNGRSAGVASGRLLDDYRIVGRIGSGGMGEVWEAEQISLGRRVALKILPSHLSFSDASIKKFRREAAAGGRQNHHGIVAVHAVGEHEGIHFIAQELVGGGVTLADRIGRYQTVDDLPVGYFRWAARLVAKVADALGHAHSSGVIHRDVKPSNILLTPEGEPKVTDFGLAKVEDALALTRTGDLMGTPFYMSPEQAEAGRGPIDERTDIFSLGVTFYEMLTLTVPFDGKSTREVLKKILDAEPRDPGRVNARVPRDLAVICLKTLEKQRSRRYASMADLADDLGRFLEGEPIQARRAGTVTRAIKRIRRNPALSAAVGLAVVAVVVLAVLLGSLNQNKIVQAEKDVLSVRNVVSELLKGSTDTVRDDPGTALLYAVEAAKQAVGISQNENKVHLDVNNATVAALACCHELRILPTGSGRQVVFDRSGDRVFALLDSGRIAVWDWESPAKIDDPCDFGQHNTGLVFSPEGGQLALSSWDRKKSSGTVRLFDVETWTERVVFEGNWKIRDIAFSPDGNLLAVGGDDMQVHLVDPATGRVTGSLAGFGWFVSSVGFSGDGIVLAVGCEDGTVSVWNVETEAREFLFDDAQPAVVSVEFDCSAGSRELLILYESGQAELREARADRNEPVPLNDPDEARILAITFSPDQESVIAAFDDGPVRAIATGPLNEWRRLVLTDTSGDLSPVKKMNRVSKCLSERLRTELLGHRGAVLSVARNRSGNRIVTISSDGTARFWSIDAGIAGLAIRRGMTNGALSSGGRWVARASVDRKEIRVYDMAEKRSIDSPLSFRNSVEISDQDGIYRIPPDIESYTTRNSTGPGTWLGEAEVKGFSFSEDGSRLATFHTMNIIRVLDLQTGSIAAQFVHARDVSCLKFSPTGRKVAVALSNKGFYLLDVAAQDADGIRLGEHDKQINGIAFGRTGRLAATASEDGTVGVWDCEKGTFVDRFRFGDVPVTCVALSPDGRLVAAAGKNFRIRLWEIASRREISGPEMAHENRIESILFSPDGKQLLSASADRSARVWDLDGGSSVDFDDHRGAVNAVRLSPDGSLVLTVSDDKKARLWDASSGLLLYEALHDGPVCFGEFAADGETFVTATERGPVRNFPVDPVAYARSRLPCALADREAWIGSPEEDRGDEPSSGCLNTIAHGTDLCVWDWPLVDPRDIAGDRDLAPILFLVKRPLPGPDEPEGPAAVVSICLFDPLSEIPVREICTLGRRATSHLSLCPDGRRACFVEREFDDSGKLRQSLVKVLRLDGAVGAEAVSEICRLEGKSIDSIAWRVPRAIDIGIKGVGADDRRDRICRIDPEGSADQVPHMLIHRKNQFFGQPSTSRDGTMICFIHFPGAHYSHSWEIWHALLTGDGGAVVEPRQLTGDSVQDLKCRFSHDGGAIYALRARGENRDGIYGVVLHDLAKCESRVLFEIGRPGSIISFSLSRDDLVAFVVNDAKRRSNTLHIANPARRQRAEILPGYEICSPCFVLR